MGVIEVTVGRLFAWFCVKQKKGMSFWMIRNEDNFWMIRKVGWVGLGDQRRPEETSVLLDDDEKRVI